MEETRITILDDNRVGNNKSWAEHGLAILVETRSSSVLFDTGQTGAVLCHNADANRILLENIGAVVLSHGHFDHTGGLPDVLKRAERLDVFVRPEAFAPKFSTPPDGRIKEIGFPYSHESLAAAGADLHLAPDHLRELTGEIILIGGIQRTNDFEEPSRDLQVKRDGRLIVDDFQDEQVMAVRTNSGLVLILGCSHRGVVNIVQHCRQRLGSPITAVIGGMHLEKAPVARLQRTVSALNEMGVKRIMPLHCTGFGASAFLSQSFGEGFMSAGAGDQFLF